jgi:hypothetical protein
MPNETTALPKIDRTWGSNSRQRLQELGFTFTKIDGSNGTYFEIAHLPAGWSSRTTSQPDWKEVVDNKGNIRIEIFDKGLGYDHEAFYRLVD